MREAKLKICPFCGGKATFAGGNEIIPVVDDEGIVVDAEWRYCEYDKKHFRQNC